MQEPWCSLRLQNLVAAGRGARDPAACMCVSRPAVTETNPFDGIALRNLFAQVPIPVLRHPRKSALVQFLLRRLDKNGRVANAPIKPKHSCDQCIRCRPTSVKIRLPFPILHKIDKLLVAISAGYTERIVRRTLVTTPISCALFSSGDFFLVVRRHGRLRGCHAGFPAGQFVARKIS